MLALPCYTVMVKLYVLHLAATLFIPIFAKLCNKKLSEKS